MRYLIAIIVTLAFCLPAQAEILVFKTAIIGQQLDNANKAVEKKKEGGYLVINADLSNTNNIAVSAVNYLHYEIKAGMKVQNITKPSDMEIILADYGKGKKMTLRCFDETTGTYMVVYGNASVKDMGGIQRYAASSLSGSSVWRQVDYRTGSGSIKLKLDIKATKLANTTPDKTIAQIMEGYSLTLVTKGYSAE